ncbi:glycosyltransferase [Paracoccus marcusii]|uniref:glycosyltransferase n=1 Tax=Paracoccus marcusii TaxID=59779 RepID=UPI002ED4030D|nr:glycosyltransferase [Paracoccus marcusii]
MEVPVHGGLCGSADLLLRTCPRQLAGRLADVDFDTATDSTIIPQHPLIDGQVTERRRVEARRRISAALGRDLADARIVCGAGHVQWRKGTDIFVQAAQICADADPDTVFVWIGDGRNHQDMGFGVWFDYHLRQVGANRPDGNLFMLPAGPLYLDVMDAADSMFLSSRLDPLPNVVFDAVRRGQTMVCFDGATGFADDRYRGSDRITRTPMPTRPPRSGPAGAAPQDGNAGPGPARRR